MPVLVMKRIKRWRDTQAVRDVTYWRINLLIVATSANQAEAVLGLFLWSWAGGSVHLCAGPRVGTRQALAVSLTKSWHSH